MPKRKLARLAWLALGLTSQILILPSSTALAGPLPGLGLKLARLALAAAGGLVGCSVLARLALCTLKLARLRLELARLA